MTISKTTLNYAEKRGLDITTTDASELDKGCDRIELWADCEERFPNHTSEMEWLCSYLANDDGSFSFNSNILLDREVKEELPAYIRDEKHLREVLDFLASELD